MILILDVAGVLYQKDKPVPWSISRFNRLLVKHPEMKVAVIRPWKKYRTIAEASRVEENLAKLGLTQIAGRYAGMVGAPGTVSLTAQMIIAFSSMKPGERFFCVSQIPLPFRSNVFHRVGAGGLDNKDCARINEALEALSERKAPLDRIPEKPPGELIKALPATSA